MRSSGAPEEEEPLVGEAGGGGGPPVHVRVPVHVGVFTNSKKMYQCHQ